MTLHPTLPQTPGTPQAARHAALARTVRTIAAALAAAGAAAAMAAPASTPATPTATPVPAPLTQPLAEHTRQRHAMACVILPARVADLGTPAPGVVTALHVERGDAVRRGQALVRLNAAVEEAATAAARARAESQADARAAAAAEALAHQKLERARTLKAQDFISAQAVELAEAEHRVARERANAAREQLEVAAREAGGAEAQLGQRVVRAPFDGIVTERHANLGERFEERPLLRIADISRLRVDIVVPVSMFGRIAVGGQIGVVPELPGAMAQKATVVQVDRVMDPASNTFRARLEIDNRDHALPAGLRCRAELDAAKAARTPTDKS